MTYTKTLTMHTCNPEEEFACENAFCIMMKKRCDGTENCEDGSDEQDCGKLIVESGYKKSLTPVPEEGHDLPASLYLNIIDILSINELKESFSVKFSYKREWFDRRLTYKHLKQDSMMNNLLIDESESIWYPYLVFNNIETNAKVSATKVENTHRVIANKKFQYTVKDNMHLFKGSENAQSLTKEWSSEWICHYALHWYPFDTQVSRLEFISRRRSTKMLPVSLEHNPDIFLNRYTLNKIQMCRSIINERNAIVVEVTLGRPIISNILTVFIPTTTLLTISFVARFFAKDYIDMVIQVNITILLVLATL